MDNIFIITNHELSVYQCICIAVYHFFPCPANCLLVCDLRLPDKSAHTTHLPLAKLIPHKVPIHSIITSPHFCSVLLSYFLPLVISSVLSFPRLSSPGLSSPILVLLLSSTLSSHLCSDLLPSHLFPSLFLCLPCLAFSLVVLSSPLLSSHPPPFINQYTTIPFIYKCDVL